MPGDEPLTLAVILAAGRGERMGMPKAMLDAGDGTSFLTRLVRTYAAAGIDAMAVVGFDAARVAAAHPEVSCLENRLFESGQYSSVKAGLRICSGSLGLARVLVQPVDAPLLSVAGLSTFLAASAGFPAAFASHRGQPGHPVSLSRATICELLESRAGGTLADALRRFAAVPIEVDDPWVTKNLNTPEDYQAVFGHLPHAL